jgi:hypothetical protein
MYVKFPICAHFDITWEVQKVKKANLILQLKLR